MYFLQHYNKHKEKWNVVHIVCVWCNVLRTGRNEKVVKNTQQDFCNVDLGEANIPDCIIHIIGTDTHMLPARRHRGNMTLNATNSWTNIIKY